MLPGDAVLDIVRSASGSLLIVAPYIKFTTLERIIGNAPHGLASLTCITRWLPEDIAARVCDLEIMDLIEKFPGGRLLVHPHLHAKYYRADGRCLVGSANLTSRGLGWTTPANVELLVELRADFAGLDEWEATLLGAAIVATKALREQIRREAERLIANGALLRLPEVNQITGDDAPASQWVPRCPVPERLWSVYIGQGLDKMVTSAQETAQEDLAALEPPAGLTKDLFEAYVGGILRQMPLMAEIDGLASNGLTDSQAQIFLEDHLGDAAPYPADQTWRVLKAWLIHFFGQTYRLEVGQEVLVKGKDLSS